MTNENSVAGYEVHYISEWKGRGLFAKKDFKKGDLILEETPLVCAQFSWNAAYGYLACDHCMRPLESAEENAHRLSGGSVTSLPFPECSPTDKSTHAECPLCKVKYCSPDCQSQASSQYHKTLCYDRSDASSPFYILEETWKKMHYPPESCSIMLLARIFALIHQSSDKQTVVETFSTFCSTSNEGSELLEDKLGTEFGSRIAILRELLVQCFPSETTSPWLTESGFQWLFTMVAVNGQGVGTSVFSEWVENVQPHNNEKLEQKIGAIYEQLFEHSGCEFLNNEGSALYRIQSSSNHSCTPNAEIKFPHSNFVLNLVATEDIRPGEEICISYIDEDFLQRGRETRNKYLRSNYYFTCSCVKCESQLGDPESESSEDESMSLESDSNE